MENQLLTLIETELPLDIDGCQIEELFDLQLTLVGGGCVEYCPY
jgi:hypothetical protein